MNGKQNLKVLELRNYLIKPGERDRFIKYFENHFIDSQIELGSYPIGQFTVEGEPDKFFWIRGFADMQSRLNFLDAFYVRGAVWKQFGPEANEMLLDWTDVYLLRPLGDAKRTQDSAKTINSGEFEKLKSVVTIDFYFAKNNRLDDLINLFQADYIPFLDSQKINDTMLFVSEMAENDFPRLPVIQDKNLLVTISSYENEADYRAKSERIDSINNELKNRSSEFIADKRSLIIYSTRKAFVSDAS